MAELELDLVLVPVDGSDESRAAVEYAVAIADRYGAAVHAVYVLGEPTVRGIETGAVDEGKVADDTEAFGQIVRDIASEGDVPLSTSVVQGFSTEIKTLHPGSVVLDTADELDANFIVVPREPAADTDSDVLEKAAEYVLQYASQPVLSV